ncbi:hypothetical protein [Roseibacillus persicicus]|nr:hypothetical protein [Roseibacillus persicicus]
MMKRWSLISMAGALLGAVSCTPVGGAYGGAGAGSTPGMATVRSGSTPVSSVGSGQRATSEELRELREQRAELSGGNGGTSGAGMFGGGGSAGGATGEQTMAQAGAEAQDLPPLPPMNIDYRYAMPVPSRKGWVFNPYTNRPVDVRGVESGRLIYDERDPANRNPDGTLLPVDQMPHKFRVP